MKKAWQDVKSFVTIIFAIAFVIFTFMKIITGEQFYSIFQIIIAFYFGTQYQKMVTKLEDKEGE
jgi:DMSO/TMAO reductase YedYZ heme-binding membrane subunit